MAEEDIDDAARVDRADLDAIVADALVVVDQVQSLEPYLPQLAPQDRERVDDYVRRASADSTLRAYKSDWRLFCAWCHESGYRPLPATPATVAAFLTLLAESGFSPQNPRRTKRGTVLPRKEPV
ncbi:MAG: DNA recombinase, partial [Sphingomonas sp.]